MSNNSEGVGKFIGCLGQIIVLIAVASIWRLGVGWFSYDDQLEKIKAMCISDSPSLQQPPGEGNVQPGLIEQYKQRSTAYSSYCTCVSDHAKQNLSRFEVAIDVGFHKDFDRNKFMQSPTMQNEKKICAGK